LYEKVHALVRIKLDIHILYAAYRTKPSKCKVGTTNMVCLKLVFVETKLSY